MSGNKLFTQIPPSSTGNRISLKHQAILQYKGLSTSFTVNETYTTLDALSNVVTLRVDEDYVLSGTTGYLTVQYDADSIFFSQEPVINNNILDSAGGIVAQVAAAAQDLYTNRNTIAGGSNLEYTADVDVFGALSTRFTEGAPQISANGELRSRNDFVLAKYIFQDSKLPQQFSNTIVGVSGSVAFENEIKSVKLQVGTAAGELVTHTSNFYHTFTPGATTLFKMATRVGDAGQAGTIRNWGAFDNEDGFFFQLSGSDFSVVHRYNFNGNGPLDHKDAQSIWNGDRADGSGGQFNPSGMNLDVTKVNSYWVDYQWIGGGQTRFGAYYQGERITFHTMYQSNGQDGPMTQYTNPLRNPARPVCWSMVNTQATGTDSELYALGAAVFSDIDTFALGASRRYDTTSPYIPANSTSTRYAFSLRPSLNLPNGDYNRSYYLPARLQVAAYNPADDAEVKAEVRIFAGCVLRGENYESLAGEGSNVDIDDSGQHLSHQVEIGRYQTFGAGGVFPLQDLVSSIADGAIKNNSEPGRAIAYQSITSITNANPAQVKVGPNPLNGLNRWVYQDRQQLHVRSATGDAGTALNGNSYYISFVDGDEGWLYTSLDGLENDRKLRTAYVTSTGSLQIGDSIVFQGFGSASVQSLTYDTATSTGSIALEGRTSVNVDVGTVTTGTHVSSSGAGVGTVFYLTSGSTTSYPKDYETSLNALDGSGWGAPATTGQLTGSQPPYQSWTFMIRPYTAKAFDVDTRWNMSWREVTQ
tara:strand:+ start:5582 stop:7849 length:2268 start_codon:yes stop_codon:yes gene_type:complete